MITTVLAFIVTLGLLIIVHEYGHYRVAVACGVKVQRFSIGFGRVLWSRQRGETEFAISAIPLGGYVSMLDEREGPVGAHELDRAFNRKPLWQRTAIVAAGPIANLLLAVLLYAGAHWVGIEEPKAVLGTPVAGSLAERAGLHGGDWVRTVSEPDGASREVRSLNDLRWEVTQAVIDGRSLELTVSDMRGRGSRPVTLDLNGFSSRDIDTGMLRRIGVSEPYTEPVLGDVKPGPAYNAGLRTGDRVLSIDGEPAIDGAQLRERIRASGRSGAPVAMHWRVERQGQVLEFDVQPEIVKEGNRTIGRIQAVPSQPPQMVTVRYGVVEGVTHAVQRTWDVSALTVTMLGRMLVGEASIRNLSGPLTVADYAGQSAQRGLADFLNFLALVSVSLGVFNLLPLPMLDGGHLMYYLFEGVTGRSISDNWLRWLQRSGAAIMVLFMSIALSNDVFRLFNLH